MNTYRTKEFDMLERQIFDSGVDALFDARLRPVVDEKRQARSQELQQARLEGVGKILVECRAGEYGGVARQAIETLRRQAKTFLDVEKSCHGLVSRPDPRTKQYENQEIQRAWAAMQLTMMKLEKLGVEWGDIPEWELAPLLVSQA